MLKILLKVFLIITLTITSLFGGWKWKAAKTTTKLALKGYVIYKIAKKSKKIFKRVVRKKPDGSDRVYYERNDIDPDLLVSRFIKRKNKVIKIIETNSQIMKDGRSPHILIKKKNKIVTDKITLHHSEQNDKGVIFEVKNSTHSISPKKDGGKALHPYKPNKHPHNPVDKVRGEFDKERKQHWKNRAKEMEKKNEN